MKYSALLLVTAFLSTLSGANGPEIPSALAAEHQAIESALLEATKAPGPTGTAAKALQDVLAPHFHREQQIALPPLGLLEPLAAGQIISEQVSNRAIAMTEALRKELPQMLKEHQEIRRALEAFEQASRGIHHELGLALHAQTEEQVLYPAAILVGEILQKRRAP